MVELRDDQRRIRVSALRLKRQAQQVLEALGLGERTLSILLTDDRRMAGFHERWMGEEGPTDVMSFSMGDAAVPGLLGDVVISVETAARRRPRDVFGETRRYLVHGILHLAGHDHRTRKERERMNRLARAVGRSLR